METLLWSSFVLGALGSLHCAGMCGPLALAIPGTGPTRAALLAGRLAYNGGRIVTYSLLGALLGLFGQGFAWAGLQRWVSIVAGAALLIGVLVSSRWTAGLPAIQAVGWLKRGFSQLLNRRTVGAVFLLGVLNGFLPCGLVYAAGAGAVAAGDWSGGVTTMVVFGLGTVPMMFGLSLVGPRFQVALRFKLQRLIPASLMIVGSLLILRGLALGIPYLSPELSGSCPNCH
jgi:hypothetical protein